MEDNKELIKYLLEALKQELPKDGYRTLRFVLNRLVDIRLRNIPIQFSGLFAKTNYILTEHKAPKRLIRTVENTRQRIRHFDEIDNSELSRYFLYDLKSITSLFQLIYPDAEIPEVLTKALPYRLFGRQHLESGGYQLLKSYRRKLDRYNHYCEG